MTDEQDALGPVSPTTPPLISYKLLPMCMQSACMATSVYMWPVFACSWPWHPQYLAVSTQLVQILTPPEEDISDSFLPTIRFSIQKPSSNPNPKLNNSMPKALEPDHHPPNLRTHQTRHWCLVFMFGSWKSSHTRQLELTNHQILHQKYWNTWEHGHLWEPTP